MEIGSPTMTSFMGIDVINIGGFALNSFCAVSMGMSEGIRTSKRCKPWDPTKLQASKQQHSIDNLLVFITDEISMVIPWTLAYLDDRLKEAKHIYGRLFGGVAD